MKYATGVSVPALLSTWSVLPGSFITLNRCLLSLTKRFMHVIQLWSIFACRYSLGLISARPGLLSRCTRSVICVEILFHWNLSWQAAWRQVYQTNLEEKFFTARPSIPLRPKSGLPWVSTWWSLSSWNDWNCGQSSHNSTGNERVGFWKNVPRSLSDLGNRNENTAGRGQILSILQDNSCSIDQKSGEIWTVQTNLQRIYPKPERPLDNLLRFCDYRSESKDNDNQLNLYKIFEMVKYRIKIFSWFPIRTRMGNPATQSLRGHEVSSRVSCSLTAPPVGGYSCSW
jgi:hypothetical protein